MDDPYRPPPRPTGPNTPDNPYYRRDQNVRIAREEETPQAFTASGGGPTTQGPFDATNWLDLPLGGTWIDLAAYASTSGWPTSPDNNVAYVMDFRVPPGPPNELDEYVFTFHQDGVFLGNSAFQVDQLPAQRQVSFANPATSRLTITTNNGDVTLFDVAFPTFTEPSQEFPPGTLDAHVEAILAGTKGFVLDPKDLSTMWQDSAGTIPVTTLGQPVGRLAGKWGTAPVVYSAINAGARPVLTVDGIQFDGVDDVLRSPNLIDTFRNAAGTCVVARLVPGVTVGGEVITFVGESTTVTRVGMRVLTAALRHEISQVDTAGNITRATQNDLLTPGVGVTVAAVSDLVVDRFLRTFADGVATTSTALVTPNTIMPDTPSAFAQLGRPNSNNTFYDGALGRVVFYPFAPTPEQRAIFEAWVSA